MNNFYNFLLALTTATNVDDKPTDTTGGHISSISTNTNLLYIALMILILLAIAIIIFFSLNHYQKNRK